MSRMMEFRSDKTYLNKKKMTIDKLVWTKETKVKTNIEIPHLKLKLGRQTKMQFNASLERG
jgi:hypothetical protein